MRGEGIWRQGLPRIIHSPSTPEKGGRYGPSPHSVMSCSKASIQTIFMWHFGHLAFLNISIAILTSQGNLTTCHSWPHSKFSHLALMSFGSLIPQTPLDSPPHRRNGYKPCNRSRRIGRSHRLHNQDTPAHPIRNQDIPFHFLPLFAILFD